VCSIASTDSVPAGSEGHMRTKTRRSIARIRERRAQTLVNPVTVNPGVGLSGSKYENKMGSTVHG
jgi:hypothetical protein